uniref:Uncharacterized protein n=1 Tax=Bosea sp. NBC_00436 TaxID=2969620 RepID=A0A9E8CQV5_9HYPH
MTLKTSTTGLTSAAAVDAQWLEIEERLAAMEGGGLIKDEIMGVVQDPVDHSLIFPVTAKKADLFSSDEYSPSLVASFESLRSAIRRSRARNRASTHQRSTLADPRESSFPIL